MEQIFEVVFNSSGGWDWSQSFRITAMTANFIAAVACGDGEQHNLNHNARGGTSFQLGERIVVKRNDIDEDGVIWGAI